MVSEAAVIGLPHNDWGEEVCAIVVLNETGQIDGPQLTSYCRERLAGYKTPKRIVIQTESLPKNHAGKIMNKKLLEQLTTKATNKS